MIIQNKGKMFDFITKTWNPVAMMKCHGCVYCVTGETLVLMADLSWKPIKNVYIGDNVIGFSENPVRGYRFLELAMVTGVNRHVEPVYEIRTSLGSLRCNDDHLWLIATQNSHNNSCYRNVLSIKKYGYPIRYLIQPYPKPKIDDDYMKGYLAGLMLDGTSRLTPEGMRHEKASYFRIAISDIEALYRSQSYLSKWNINLSIRPFSCKAIKKMFKLETWTSKTVEQILELCLEIESDDYKLGYLAGGFDAEGSMSQNNLRISNYDDEINKKIKQYGNHFNFNFVIEDKGTRLKGGLDEHLRFFFITYPAISRKKLGVLRALKQGKYAEIQEITSLGKEYVYDISTTSSTFFANGFYSHNCWATALKKGRLKDFPRYRDLTDESDPVLIAHELSKRFDAEDFVFVETMGDLFFDGLPDRFIYAVIEVIKGSPAMFLLLTKNPERMMRFFPVFPKNVMLGITIESDKDYPEISDAPLQSQRFKWATEIARSLEADDRGIKLFISIEPILDFTNRFYTQLYWLKKSLWGVAIGYDNYIHRLPEPSLKNTNELIRQLDKILPRVYLKTLRKKR